MKSVECPKKVYIIKTKMKNIHFYLIILVACLFMACRNSQNPTEPQPKLEKEGALDSTSLSSQISKESEFLYTWVDKLNIRKTPDTKSQTVTIVESKTPLKYTGEKSEESESIVLRGVCYDEPWLRIITPDKMEGWVFGGAVRRKGESKGNKIITEEHFEFPHFGSFNLKEWERLSQKDESGGDAEIITTIYKKGNQVLEISYIDVGDYGYGRTYRLMDSDNKILKERELNFSADAEIRELKEVVKDFTTQPRKQYTRIQKFKKHHSQLNALPLMVNGIWSESNI